MNYKTIILLLALFFIILLIYREVYNLNTKLRIQEENQRKEHEELVNNVNKCLTQIKSANYDNINQLKTITMINQQLATKQKKNTMNGFTETTGEKLSKYSDSEDDQPNEYYMSSLTNKEDISKQSESQSPNRENQDNVIVIPERETENNTENIPGEEFQEPISIHIPGPMLLSPFFTMTNVLTSDLADMLFNNQINENYTASPAKIEEIIEEERKEEIVEKEVTEVKELKAKPNKLKTLKDISTYNITELRNMCKKYGLQSHIKENNKTRLYKKDELYQNIKHFLETTENIL